MVLLICVYFQYVTKIYVSFFPFIYIISKILYYFKIVRIEFYFLFFNNIYKDGIYKYTEEIEFFILILKHFIEKFKKKTEFFTHFKTEFSLFFNIKKYTFFFYRIITVFLYVI